MARSRWSPCSAAIREPRAARLLPRSHRAEPRRTDRARRRARGRRRCPPRDRPLRRGSHRVRRSHGIHAASDVVAHARVQRKTGLVQQLRGKASEALATFDDVLARLPPDATSERVRVLLNTADLQFRNGKADVAIDHLREALTDAERVDDSDAVAEAFKQLGTIYAYKGELGQALAYQERSLEAYVRLGDVLGEANVHNNIGRTERRRSRLA